MFTGSGRKRFILNHNKILFFLLESTNMVSKEIQVYHKNLGDWVKLSEMESPAYCHCLVVLNDYLFVVGGQEIFGKFFRS